MEHEIIPAPWFPFVVDMNGDQRFTITDLGIWAAKVFFLPGDWMIWKLVTAAPGLARFLELSPADYGGLLSNVLSVLFWLLVLLACYLLWRFVRAVDDKLTGWVLTAFEAVKLRARILLIQARARKDKDKTEDIHFADDIQLNRIEFNILKAHSNDQRSAPLDLDKLAGLLKIQVRDVERCMDRLRKLGLLQRSRALGHSLTQSGSAYLVYKQLA